VDTIDFVIAPKHVETTEARARTADPIRGSKQERRRAQIELLRTFTHRELRGRYRDSVLGSAWTLLQPLLMTGIYYFIFSFLFKASSIPHYALFVLIGIIVWNFYATVIASGTNSLTGNADVIQKVWFRREILPLSLTLANAFTTGILLLLALIACVISTPAALKTVLLVPLVFALLMTLAFGIACLLAVANVFFRDVAHLVSVVLLPLFFLTPVFYSLDAFPVTPPDWVITVMRYGNPLTPYLESIRALALQGQIPGWPLILYCIVVGPTMAIIGIKVLRMNDDQMAVEL
jgi:lipopolysaccharide transport system permease protein